MGGVVQGVTQNLKGKSQEEISRDQFNSFDVLGGKFKVFCLAHDLEASNETRRFYDTYSALQKTASGNTDNDRLQSSTNVLCSELQDLIQERINRLGSEDRLAATFRALLNEVQATSSGVGASKKS
jgi:hypothetical protein